MRGFPTLVSQRLYGVGNFSGMPGPFTTPVPQTMPLDLITRPRRSATENGSVKMGENRATYAARWFDQADFTSEHDRLFERLLVAWKRLVPKPLPGVTIVGEIRGEPSLAGYPPIYPDAIAYGHFECDHRDAGIDWKANGGLCLQCRAFVREFPRTEMCRAGDFKVVFEIKPKIDSLGSVMRQLQMYRDRAELKIYNGLGHVILITSDSRFDDSFENQGFIVVHPSKNVYRTQRMELTAATASVET